MTLGPSTLRQSLRHFLHICVHLENHVVVFARSHGLSIDSSRPMSSWVTVHPQEVPHRVPLSKVKSSMGCCVLCQLQFFSEFEWSCILIVFSVPLRQSSILESPYKISIAMTAACPAAPSSRTSRSVIYIPIWWRGIISRTWL